MKISDDAFKYLYVQRGEVSDSLQQGRIEWERAYADSLAGIMNQITPFLPVSAKNLLDVGSGLGGIDMLIRKATNVKEVFLLDGADYPAEVVRHSTPFNSHAVTQQFWGDNGAYRPVCIDSMEHFPEKAKVNLLVSFASWCFHFPPDTYLYDIVNHLSRNTTVVLDLRKDRDDWYNELCDTFRCTGKVIHTGKKHKRIVWKL